jgi:Tfp pilus assembly protein FimT
MVQSGRSHSCSKNRTIRQRRKSNIGFTLLGLLIVLAVIAILAAFLFPSLNRAKDSVRRTVCANNLSSSFTSRRCSSGHNGLRRLARAAHADRCQEQVKFGLIPA